MLKNLRCVIQIRGQTLSYFLGPVLESLMAAEGTVRMSRTEIEAKRTVMALIEKFNSLIQVVGPARKLVVESVGRWARGRKVSLAGGGILLAQILQSPRKGPQVWPHR